MKTKIFVVSFITVTILIGVLCGRKTDNEKLKKSFATTEISEENNVEVDTTEIPMKENIEQEEDYFITGYFNHDNILDTAFLVQHVPQQSKYGDGNCSYTLPVYFENENDSIEWEEIWEDCSYFTIRFSDSTIPSIKVIGFDGSLRNIGDLNNNGTDELIFFPAWYQSMSRYYYVWTLSNNKWINVVEPVFIWLGHEGFVNMNVKSKPQPIITPHPTKKGYVLIHYSEWIDEYWKLITKDVKTGMSEQNKTSTKEDLYDFEKIHERVALIIELVKKRDKEGLSQIIRYPLEREYPVPPVKNAKELIARFDEIFDATMIEKISKFYPEDISVSWRGAYLDSNNIPFLGFECFYDDYNIKFIECSGNEKRTRYRFVESEREDLHESLKTFLYPVVMMETPTCLIRIDCMSENDDYDKNFYRFASWAKGSSISDKPDLILTDGVESVRGSELHTFYRFINENYMYECGTGISGNPQHIELFRIYKNFKINDYGEVDGELIFEEGTAYRNDYQKRDEINLLYWSEERELRKPKKESGQD